MFATKPAAEWEAQLADAGAAVGPVRSIEDLLDDPHLPARGALVELDDDRHTRVLRTPVRLRDATGAERAGAPPAHRPRSASTPTPRSADAGFTADEIAALPRPRRGLNHPTGAAP